MAQLQYRAVCDGVSDVQPTSIGIHTSEVDYSTTIVAKGKRGMDKHT